MVGITVGVSVVGIVVGVSVVGISVVGVAVGLGVVGDWLGELVKQSKYKTRRPSKIFFNETTMQIKRVEATVTLLTDFTTVFQAIFKK